MFLYRYNIESTPIRPVFNRFFIFTGSGTVIFEGPFFGTYFFRAVQVQKAFPWLPWRPSHGHNMQNSGTRACSAPFFRILLKFVQYALDRTYILHLNLPRYFTLSLFGSLWKTWWTVDSTLGRMSMSSGSCDARWSWRRT